MPIMVLTAAASGRSKWDSAPLLLHQSTYAPIGSAATAAAASMTLVLVPMGLREPLLRRLWCWRFGTRTPVIFDEDR